jgi:hypothetical protein
LDAVALLRHAREAGLRFEPIGDRLVVRGPKAAEPMVRLLAQHKAEVLAALAPNPGDVIEANHWHERLRTRTFEWAGGKRDRRTARWLAWGDLQNEWWRRNGRRWPAWQCAGCQRPIGASAMIELPDGNHVHLEPIDCILTFGRRWRSEADAALTSLGLKPPD